MDPPAIKEKQQEDLHLPIAIAVDAKDTWGIDTTKMFPRDKCYLLPQVGSRSLKRMGQTPVCTTTLHSQQIRGLGCCD